MNFSLGTLASKLYVNNLNLGTLVSVVREIYLMNFGLGSQVGELGFRELCSQGGGGGIGGR